MDQVLADTLTAALKSAETMEAQMQALVLTSIAVVDCQHKTSERVKDLVAEREAEKNRRRGARWAVGCIISAASVVGPIAAIKICKIVGIMF